MPSSSLWLVMLLLTLAAAARSWQLRRTQSVLAQRLASAIARQTDIARTRESLERLALAQRLSEAVAAGGTATVQAVHRGIASIPFGILEAIPVTRDTTRIVRGVHDLTANSVYGSIRGINRLVGGQLRKGLGDSSNARPADEEAEDDDGKSR